jgi:hypothetical protein
MATLKSKRQQDILTEWVGAWIANPQSEKDLAASELAIRAIRFTKADSLISPVAVAAIDILGMKSLLETKSLEEIAERFAEPFYGLDAPVYGLNQVPVSVEQLESMGYQRMAGIYPAVISDTILLVRRPDWENGNSAIAEADAVVWLAQYVGKIMKINSLYGIRLRSAISFGECLVSIGDRPALLGAPTGEASAWERQQEWIGGMLTPSAVDTLRRGAEAAKQINGDDFEPRYPNCLVQYPIPLKRTCPMLPEPQIALNWITGLMPGATFLKANVPAKEADDAPEDVKRKVANTIEFAEHCKKGDLTTAIVWNVASS